MSTWAEMSYDEQRALLGLPDVRYAVAGMRARIAGRRMVAAFARLGDAFRSAVRELTREPTQSDYVLARGKGP